MPTKYTIEKVANKFIENGCVLLETNYVNHTQKLNYTASCGHNNAIIFKTFLKGAGVKCRNCALEIPTYEFLCEKFEEKKCKLCYTKEEFDNYYTNNKQKLIYIALCGHKNNVSWKNFNSLNQGINCPSCVNKNTGLILKELRSNNKNGSLEQEYDCITYFTELVKDTFNVVKAFDGCKADIIIKPTTILEDEWLGIQVKTTNKKTEREQYYFRLNNGKYDNCLLLCICEEDKKTWLIPYSAVDGLKTIGIAKKSKYNIYEVTIDNIKQKLQEYYTSSNTFCFDILDLPTSDTHKQEQEFRKMRESKIDFIEFINNDMEGLVYDFMINNKRIQEKVGSITHNNPNSFSFNLSKNAGRINGKSKSCCYKEGDNDFYWLNCKNNEFYVIPEYALIKNGFVGKDCTRPKLYVSPTNTNTNWCNEYLFDYENVDKDKLMEIINNK